MNISPQTHAHCDQCGTIRPFSIVDLPGDDVSGRFREASDLCCSDCGFIIATLYVPKPRTKAAEAINRQMRRPRR